MHIHTEFLILDGGVAGLAAAERGRCGGCEHASPAQGMADGVAWARARLAGTGVGAA